MAAKYLAKASAGNGVMAAWHGVKRHQRKSSWNINAKYGERKKAYQLAAWRRRRRLKV